MRIFSLLPFALVLSANAFSQCPTSGCMPGLTTARTPAWRGEPGNEFSGWLSMCHGTNALRPDEPGSNSDDATLQQLDVNGFATATCNIYNFTATSRFEIVDDISGDVQEILVQTRSLATPLDPLSFTVEYIDTMGRTQSVAPTAIGPLPGFDEMEVRWDLSAIADEITEYKVVFAALGASCSLNNVWMDVRAADRPLVADVDTVSRIQGGTQNLFVDAGAARAGDTFLFLGSASGTSPGLFFGPGLELELAFDPYMMTLLKTVGSSSFEGQSGLLDGRGTATAAIHVPPTIAFSDLDLHHGFVVFTTSGVGFTSNVQILKLRR